MISKERNLKRRGKALPLVVPFFWLRPHFAGAVPAVKAVRKSDAETLQTRYAHMKLITAITPIH